jgi:protein-S-isoprenylcysteine O-methyltransferase Ste14
VATDVRIAPVAPSRRRRRLLFELSANLIGAAGAAYFALASVRYYQQTHRLIGVGFVIQQLWVAAAYLVRRPPGAVSRRTGDWLLAFAGTFGGVLLRPSGAHPQWGLTVGFDLQVVGVMLCVVSLFALGRSFGFAAADRGLVQRGPYALVRHPIYAAYLLLQIGYLLQSISVWNAAVVLVVTGSNVGRAIVEERVFATTAEYDAYAERVRWRLIPGVW